MARISSYPRDREVQDEDSWIGTESSNRITRNFSAKAIAEYLNIKGKISISSQMVFQLDQGAVSDGQFNGVFTGDPFSAASSLVISHRDMSTQEVVAFLDYLVGSEILISEQKEISNFGHYEITSYTLIPLTTTYTLNLTYIGGNGAFEDLKYYDFATFTISSRLNTTYDLNSNQVGANAAVNLVSSDATTDTVTLIAGTSITLTDDGSSNITIDAANPNQTVTLTGDVTGTGTTSIATTISAGAVDFAMLNPTDVITAAEGIENNDNDVTIPTSAAVKAYADSLIVGGLIYQGGYNASTNTPDLTTSPNSILKGWTYTVTLGGTFFGEVLEVGDVLIAEVNDPSALADWTTVQNNIDLASLTQVGIGNVNIDGAGNKDGLSLAYASGTATVGLNITDLPGLSVAITAADLAAIEIPLFNGDTSDANEKTSIATILSVANSEISKAYTISDTATITYPFTLTNQNDVIIQLVDTVTNETVYADVDRISPTQATITFAATPTNSIKVLVQKIGK